VTLEFLCADLASAGTLARSPMAGQAAAAGARFQPRDGWSVAADYGDPQAERQALENGIGWCDTSHLGKLELQCDRGDQQSIVDDACGEPAPLGLTLATRAAGAWWCPLTPERLIAICAPARTAELRGRLETAASNAGGNASVTDITTLHASLTLAGPAVRELISRFCALDLRPASTPVRGLRPGSVARTPGLVLREDEHRFLVLFGWALGEYTWTVVEDAARHLGGRPLGVDALGEAAGA